MTAQPLRAHWAQSLKGAQPQPWSLQPWPGRSEGSVPAGGGRGTEGPEGLGEAEGWGCEGNGRTSSKRRRTHGSGKAAPRPSRQAGPQCAHAREDQVDS